MILSTWLPDAKKMLIGFLLVYSSVFFILLVITFRGSPVPRTMILMGMTLFIVWVLIAGSIQKYFQKLYPEKLVALKKHPILFFILAAAVLACLEEAVAVTITNLAPLYGVRLGEAYITASSNYFMVIFFHSVIVFIPMFATLGFFLNRYTISPFRAFILFGLVGVFAETLFTGPQAILNAPFWILVYGLVVYVPAHAFVKLERKKLSLIFYPFLLLLVAFSAAVTAWIPAKLDMPKTHFAPLRIEQGSTSLPA